MQLSSFLLLLCAQLESSMILAARPSGVSSSTSTATNPTDPPSVKINPGTILGKISNGIESFNGIPFAEAPTGSLRLKPPQPLSTSLGDFNAQSPAGACPQFIISSESTSLISGLTNSPLLQGITTQSEDCLTVAVYRSTGTASDAKLPVFFWIYGGVFELGWESQYNPTSFLNLAAENDKPFIFVTANYRVGGFGFLPGKEIYEDGASNLGLLDQRLALEWTADNIEAFGGDPEKVTIWGESAGSISVWDHLALYGGDIKYNKTGKPLFRGAIMDSGSMQPARAVNSTRGQDIYNQVIEAGGCSKSKDSLACLRGLSYEDFLNAVSAPPSLISFNGLSLTYQPRPDGVILPESPEILAKKGAFASVPFIVGDQEDEGTLFALFQLNLTSDALLGYLETDMWPLASKNTLTDLLDTYGTGNQAIINGSPFDTGLSNNAFPDFKRRAAVFGDVLFTLMRRTFLNLAVSSKEHYGTNFWSYLATYGHEVPVLGTNHASDLTDGFFVTEQTFVSTTLQKYWLNFLYSLNPNTGISRDGNPEWPLYKNDSEILSFNKNNVTIIKDEFRNDSYQLIQRNPGEFSQ